MQLMVLDAVRARPELAREDQARQMQGAHCVHYSLIFIVYTILFTICTLLKLYTIGYIAGSGEKKQGI